MEVYVRARSSIMGRGAQLISSLTGLQCPFPQPASINMARKTEIKWLATPKERDYPAAESYLNLIFDSKTVTSLLRQLKQAPVSEFKAKDIFRASGLSVLGVSNSHVKKDRKKILAEHPLSPLLLVRGKASGKVVIADGYHRLCAVYGFDEDAVIPCKIV